MPNYDDTTPLESFLFSIAAHKLTDVLRRNGRRPELALLLEDSDGGAREPAGSDRAASSMFRSAERQTTENAALGGRKPNDLLATPEGRDLVRALVLRMQSGAYS